MKRFGILLSVALIAGLVVSAFISRPASSTSKNGTIRVMVTYRAGQKGPVEGALLTAGAEMHYAFDDLNTYALSLPVAALYGISHNPNVLYVEEDPLRHMIDDAVPVKGIEPVIRAANDTTDPNGQTIPYGIDMVQARDVWDTNRDGIIDANAFTGTGRKICIIDSGLYTGHEDFAGVNVIGGWPTSGSNPWNADGLGHGTHVAGTIAAMNNTLGVVGVTPGTASLYIVRVFNASGNWVNASTLIAAAYTCRDAGANIISMSLSGPTSSTPERNAFNTLFNTNGILSVAAASNEGTTAYGYPASYPSVISVAAIDSNELHADFSNYNDQVDLSAPGVDVFSTLSYVENNTITVNGITYSGNHIEYSGRGSANGVLVNGGLCQAAGAWSGKIVLCSRGTNTFYEKVINVQSGGGAAALIYNNVAGNFEGSLDPYSSTIIGLSLSQADGQFLVANTLGMTASIASSVTSPASGYAAWSGTSMATPHVSGVAALVWSCLPTASNAQVRDALYNTAKDLGTTGRDNYYGYGLVQAKAACNSLNPTAVEVKSFAAVVEKRSDTGDGRSVSLSWETASEFKNIGYNIYRATSIDGDRFKVNATLIPTMVPPGSPYGANYHYTDTGLEKNKTYYYWLEAVDIFGKTGLTGPASVRTVSGKTK